MRGGQIDYASVTYDDDLWHHAVYTYSTANGGKLYIDGDLKQTRTDNPTSDRSVLAGHAAANEKAPGLSPGLGGDRPGFEACSRALPGPRGGGPCQGPP